jgi:hypothetical protein
LQRCEPPIGESTFTAGRQDFKMIDDIFQYYRLQNVFGETTIQRGSVSEIKRRMFRTICEFRTKTSLRPGYLVLGRYEWAEYQGMVQFLALRKVKDGDAKAASFMGLPVLQSLEDSRLEAVK